jgi:probable F420-dependent oxidoreductase
MKFWQATAFCESDQLLDLARLSEDAGFDGLMMSDHLVFPERIESRYPYTDDGLPPFDRGTDWPDPWVAIGAMAAVTQRLRFSTNVYVAPLRHPLHVAKCVGTAAHLSGDRVVLGVGAGWMREEFDVVGERFAARGRRLDEMLDVLALVWSGETVEHHGEFYDFPPLSVSPAPGRPVPIWVGGQSDAALRRAARQDGWIGTLYAPDDAFVWVERVRAAREAAGGGGDFDVVLAVYALDDLDLFRRLEDAGVTALVTAPWMLAGGGLKDLGRSSFAAKAAMVETFAETVIARMS